MTIGITNSRVVFQQGNGEGGSGGDKVWAVNATEQELNAGDKVWINKRLAYGDVYCQFGAGDEGAFISYPIGNEIYVAHTGSYYGKECFKTFFDGTNIQYAVTTNTFDINFNLQRRPGLRFSNNVIIKDNGQQKYVGNNYCILSNRYVVYKPYGSSCYIRGYDPETGIVNTTDLSTFNSSIYIHFCAIDNSNVIIRLDNNNWFTLYNVETNQEIKAWYLSESFKAYWVTDSYDVGGYVIGGTSVTENALTFAIYKFKENNVFELADDLPETLEALMYTQCVIAYDNVTGILVVSSVEENQVFFFRYDNGMFYPLPIELPEFPVAISTSSYANITSDLSLFTFNARQTLNGYNRLRVNAYKLSEPADGKWYAEPFYKYSNTSVTGFVTGEVNDDGEYEVSTVLPAGIDYNLEVNPDDAEVTL